MAMFCRIAGWLGKILIQLLEFLQPFPPEHWTRHRGRPRQNAPSTSHRRDRARMRCCVSERSGTPSACIKASDARDRRPCRLRDANAAASSKWARAARYCAAVRQQPPPLPRTRRHFSPAALLDQRQRRLKLVHRLSRPDASVTPASPQTCVPAHCPAPPSRRSSPCPRATACPSCPAAS